MIQLTMSYYYYFGDLAEELGDDLNTCSSWDVLRTKKGAGNVYGISDDRETWRQVALGNEHLKSKAKDIARLVKPAFNCIYSFGVGSAYLEFLIKREDPSLLVKCSDFAPKGIERLKKVFIEADGIVNFDMANECWKTIDSGGICLLNRVAEVFDDEQWGGILFKMKCAGIKDVLFVPSDILTLKKFLRQQIKYAVFRLLGRKLTFSGFLRTKQRFISLLSELYEIVQIVNLGGSTGFLLKLRMENK